MSSTSSAEPADQIENLQGRNSNGENKYYALYVFSTNKHALITSEKISPSSKDSKLSDFEELSGCLSLLESNLEAEYDKVVRCYLLKVLSSKEDLNFENEGKFATIKFSDEAKSLYGFYYHKLVKTFSPEETNDINEAPKTCMFFICLIGNPQDIMELFCPELGAFCHNLESLLDPEDIKNQECIQQRLKSWYPSCIEYISRIIKTFEKDVAILLYCALWGNLEICCEDEDVKNDLNCLIEICSLLPKNETSNEIRKTPESPIKINIKGHQIIPDKEFNQSSFCTRISEKLNNCELTDHAMLRNILEAFRLKAIQDLNTLKRLLQKAERDHYSLYRSYQFLSTSGYDDILLHHVEQEVILGGEEEALSIISCLRDFLKQKKIPKNCIK